MQVIVSPELIVVEPMITSVPEVPTVSPLIITTPFLSVRSAAAAVPVLLAVVDKGTPARVAVRVA